MALSPLHLTLRLGQRRIRRCEFRIQTLIPLAIDGSCANAAGRATARGPSSEKKRCGIGKPRRTWTLSCPRPMRLVMLTRSQLGLNTFIAFEVDRRHANASSGLTPLRRKSFSLNRQRGKPRMVYGQRLTNVRAPFLFQR